MYFGGADHKVAKFTLISKHNFINPTFELNEIFYNEIPLSDYEINLSFQLEREQQSRYDFINQEANAHKARQVNENQHS